MQAHCLRCRTPQIVNNPVYSINLLIRPVCQGNCPVCDATLYKFLTMAETPPDLITDLNAMRVKVAGDRAG